MDQIRTQSASHPTGAPQEEEDRNALHKFAQDIRERGTVGAIAEAVYQNPLLLVPGGTLIMAAQAALSTEAEEGSQDSCQRGGGTEAGGFDLASALAPVASQEADRGCTQLPLAASLQPTQTVLAASCEAPAQQAGGGAPLNVAVESVDLLGLDS
eukprot:TRINITY_DN110707_c0_g1_i1.p1 TRINITY_DN110707_c0_g1~~TRINITY_DN110707_c0_g1_i1.p1  ORF type:complete len:155 (-),score=42.21 TRINITY_DN110707_c0_g1_i1:36-500(-)